jgi:hypothetical protein
MDNTTKILWAITFGVPAVIATLLSVSDIQKHGEVRSSTVVAVVGTACITVCLGALTIWRIKKGTVTMEGEYGERSTLPDAGGLWAEHQVVEPPSKEAIQPDQTDVTPLKEEPRS